MAKEDLQLEETEYKDSYKVKLEQFEGPLDLLLHLIKDAKIDIKDIFISKITDQYLKYVTEMKDISMESVSEFVAMAATLLEIKSRKLLPKIEETLDDPEDPEQKLIRQLEEYKLFKEVSEQLKSIEDVDKFYKEPEPAACGYRYELKDISFNGLIEAFTSLMHRVTLRSEVPTIRKIEKDRFTVAQKIAEIKDILLIEEEVKFSSLFNEDYSKSEIINTFLALLELLKFQHVKVNQKKLFDEIYIKKNNDTESELGTIEKITSEVSITSEKVNLSNNEDETDNQPNNPQTETENPQTENKNHQEDSTTYNPHKDEENISNNNTPPKIQTNKNKGDKDNG